VQHGDGGRGGGAINEGESDQWQPTDRIPASGQ